ncbi:triacylglycerol lipase [Actinomadura craniellae]|uniref:Triacylglycerol lipase n=1 Tax=Actinomadura craniellae TaxID=2231787 RepID=A0A365H307_9ACTN|nr:lipase family protein [Actinomadura craniellae]RAY13372.1 triacylglycerol lipase [Actinomadura craniellae]
MGAGTRRLGITRRALRAALVVGLGAALTTALPGGTAAAAPTPAEDPFYTPPSPLPAGSPGDVIRSRVVDSSIDGARAEQVLYRSESATGAPIAVSGIVLTPQTPWTGSGKRPLVSYAVGTRGIGDQCAPSYTIANGGDYEGGFIGDALEKGWAVAVSDMEGLGTPGQHTYEVGRSQGKAVLNAARAAKRLPGAGLAADTPVGLMGYSQGGTSAGWAAELAPTYAPDLNLKGVSAGGVPADLLAVARALDGGLFVAFALMAAVGYDAAYPDLKLADYLNDEGRKLLDAARDVCLVSGEGISMFVQTAFKRTTHYTHTDPLATKVWQDRLNENKLGSTKPPVPVFQPHAFFDEIIPFSQAEALRKDWCRLGANVTWKVYYVSEHAIGILRSSGDSLNFLNDRFNGVPVRGNC